MRAMALVRILVDGYSLLHNWPELARGKPRHSAAAREELIHILTQYRDATRTPITIFFDGGGAPAGTPKNESTRTVEVLFSKAGQTADDMIERAAHRFQPGFIVGTDLLQAGLDAGPQSFQSVVLGFAELFHAAGQRFREVVLGAGELFAMAAVLVFKAFGEAADVLVQFHPLFGI